MRRPVPKKVTVVVDSREHTPFVFPKAIMYYPYHSHHNASIIRVDRSDRQLKTGDYLLDEWPDCCVLERKASRQEVTKNLLSDDWKRTRAVLDRLREESQFPYLVLDGTPRKFLLVSSTREGVCSPDPQMMLSNLVRECNRRSIPIMWTGDAHSPKNRRAVGTYLVHLMLAHALDTVDSARN